ncbi:transmembrane protein 6/97 [Exophiala viscosa]|uniref:transmembrane protein 6/97 n=1 Tax=Exophiala viscosa TaxID=2486360 RepID=UPI0021931D58|nr:transmembrane protein 6/97 [Exophiala viscosa]
MTTQHRPRPLLARKLDIVYLVFFVIHIPVMLLIDLAPFIPYPLRPQLSHTLRNFYIERYNDRFFSSPPAWFTMYMYLEAAYHLPLSAWMVWAIPNDHPLLALNLLIFALETAITTLTCVVEVASWDGYTAGQKGDLYSLYVPYLVVACLMGIDAFFRLKTQILGAKQAAKDKRA